MPEYGATHEYFSIETYSSGNEWLHRNSVEKQFALFSPIVYPMCTFFNKHNKLKETRYWFSYERDYSFAGSICF